MAGRNCSALARRNPIPSLDDRVRFEEARHRYFIDGHLFSGPSVTALVASTFDGVFDAQLIIKTHLPNWRTNSTSRYHNVVAGLSDDDATDAILEMWSKANKLGTATHLSFEFLLNDESPPASDLDVSVEIAQFKQFLTDFASLEPLRTELCVVWRDEKSDLVTCCGQLDALFKCRESGKVAIVDFKRTLHDLSSEAPNYGKMGKVGSPLEGVVKNDFSTYSLQQSLYATMLAQAGIEVDACWLLKVHRELASYELVQCADLSKEARQLLATAGNCCISSAE